MARVKRLPLAQKFLAVDAFRQAGDLRVTSALAGHVSFSGNPSRFLIASAGPTLGFMMMSPDESRGTPGFLLKTSRAAGYDVGSRASAWPIAYESALPEAGADGCWSARVQRFNCV